MEQPLLDLSFLYDVSDNDPVYIYDVINLFLEVVPVGLSQLDQLVHKTDDFDAIHKQAHFLKSSAAIIKIKDVFDDLVRIVALSRECTGKEEIVTRLNNILANFKQALPIILTEKKNAGKQLVNTHRILNNSIKYTYLSLLCMLYAFLHSLSR